MLWSSVSSLFESAARTGLGFQQQLGKASEKPERHQRYNLNLYL